MAVDAALRFEQELAQPAEDAAEEAEEEEEEEDEEGLQVRLFSFSTHCQ